MSTGAAGLQHVLGVVYGNYGDEDCELSRLTSFSDNSATIRNAIKKEVVEVVCVLVDVKETEHLFLVPSGERGHCDIMRDDYLPIGGRMICRLTHLGGYQVFLPPVGAKKQEAIVIVEGLVVKIMPGEKRPKEPQEKPDQEQLRELIEAALEMVPSEQ